MKAHLQRRGGTKWTKWPVWGFVMGVVFEVIGWGFG